MGCIGRIVVAIIVVGTARIAIAAWGAGPSGRWWWWGSVALIVLLTPSIFAGRRELPRKSPRLPRKPAAGRRTSKAPGQRSRTPSVAGRRPSGVIRTKVVGVSFEGRQQIIAQHCYDGMPLELLPEPNNPHDGNAIGVWAEGMQIGYIKAELAKRLRPKLLEGATLSGTILQVTGEDLGNYGVNIELTV